MSRKIPGAFSVLKEVTVSSLTELQATVLDILRRNNGPMSTVQVSKAMSFSQPYGAQRYLAELSAAGIIESSAPFGLKGKAGSYRLWFITEHGRTIV